jgi:hypothetical protein
MAKITEPDLRSLFDVVSDVKSDRLDFYIDAAGRTLRSWIGDAVYDLTDEDDDFDETRDKALRFAEAHLAVYHLLLNTGARIRRSGVVKKEQDAGGALQNQTVNEYLTADELQTLRAEFYETAREAAQPYLLTAAAASRSRDVLIPGGWAE